MCKPNLKEATDDLKNMFSRLSVPDSGISTEWLQGIRQIKVTIFEMVTQFGASYVVPIVEEITSTLKGSARAVWKFSDEISNHIEFWLKLEGLLRESDNHSLKRQIGGPIVLDPPSLPNPKSTLYIN